MNEVQLEKQFQKAYDFYEAENYREAFNEYYALAEQGYSNCQTFVGWMYFAGKGIEKNYTKAEEWLTKAANANDAESMFYLGKLFIENKDYEKAINWFEKSADQNYAPSVYKLGCLYERNKSIKNDKQKAYSLFKQASDLGHLFARRDYAIKLLKGYGGVFSWFKGVYLYLTVFFSAIKIANADPDDERLKT